MKKHFRHLWKLGTTINLDNDARMANSCAGRIVSALTLIFVIACLAVWITAFLLLKDRVFSQTLSGSLLTDLTCVTFFGGLALAVIVGALAGNLLRRAFWKRLISRRKP